MGTNYNHFNLPGKKLNLWLICIAAMVIIVLLTVFVPQIPSVVFIFANAAFGQYMATNLQGKLIEEHIKEGSPLYNVWGAVGISLIVTAVYVALMLAAFYAQDNVVGDPSY
jgi:hypothetical protein